MGTLSLRIRYRPIRVGWCVRDGNFEDLRKVLRLTHTLWGGRYNPVIPVDGSEFGRMLVDLFRVDVLYPAAEDKAVRDFLACFPYLPWPFMHRELFLDSTFGKRPVLLDLYHPIRLLYQEYARNPKSPPPDCVVYQWEADDPLGDVLLAMFGSFPSADEVGQDYCELIEKHLGGSRIRVEKDQAVPSRGLKALTPSSLTTYHLLRRRQSLGWDDAGFYVGDANDFKDLVNFWNLRAAGLALLFYDPGYSHRLDLLGDAYLKALRKRPQVQSGRENRIAIWSKPDGVGPEILKFGTDADYHCVSAPIWNGLNLKPAVVHFPDQSVLATVTREADTPTVSFQLPAKPFLDDPALLHQRLVVVVMPLVDIEVSGEWTLHPPFVPELNQYYGRECYYDPNALRAEPEGLGVVVPVTRDVLSLRAFLSSRLTCELFATFGMSATPSDAGLLASQLVRQMGGLQGCRVFKIRGVRELIRKYCPDQSFTRSTAMQTIGQTDPTTGKPHFEDYKNLYIEPREKGDLKPENAFLYLLKKNIFRVGLEFQCPTCQLEFWLPLDDTKTFVKCAYCGNGFNVMPQLRDRDWAYRRSGLFGREDNQKGGIPVAVTLQQLDTAIDSYPKIYSGAMNIKPVTASVNRCETDFVMITRRPDGKPQLVVGECKTHGEIEQKDVENLKQVADAFPPDRLDVFIVFSKLAPFSTEEIGRCRAAQDEHRPRVILLSDRELEPYFVYERASLEFEVRDTAISLEDLAEGTRRIYFDPQPKKDA